MTHPELQPNEMWLTNATDFDFTDRVRYKSKRQGEIAYDDYGRQVEGLKPVFVLVEEYENMKQFIFTLYREG